MDGRVGGGGRIGGPGGRGGRYVGRASKMGAEKSGRREGRASKRGAGKSGRGEARVGMRGGVSWPGERRGEKTGRVEVSVRVGGCFRGTKGLWAIGSRRMRRGATLGM